MQLLAQDQKHILEHSRADFLQLRGARILITGGTGFFGKWLLAALESAIQDGPLNIEAVVLTRNPASFLLQNPEFDDHKHITFHAGDVRDFKFPQGHFSHVIHAATPASVTLNLSDPKLMFDTIVDGTHRVLEFAKHRGVSRMLLTSSGAVYGEQPLNMDHMVETHACHPELLNPRSAYAEGKLKAEQMCQDAGVPTVVSRSFAFIGQGLPLDGTYAAGNFLRDALAGGPVHVAGDGTPLRSYLYGADLAIWLWRLLVRGLFHDPVNVGSDQAVSIKELAEKIGAAYGCPSVITKKAVPGQPPKRYVPSIKKAERLYELKAWISFEEAISRTKESLNTH